MIDHDGQRPAAIRRKIVPAAPAIKIELVEQPVSSTMLQELNRIRLFVKVLMYAITALALAWDITWRIIVNVFLASGSYSTFQSLVVGGLVVVHLRVVNKAVIKAITADNAGSQNATVFLLMTVWLIDIIVFAAEPFLNIPTFW